MTVLLAQARHSTQSRDQRCAHDERHQVEHVRRLDPSECDQESAECGTSNARCAATKRVQRSGRRQLSGWHHSRNDALETGPLQAVDRRDQHGDHINGPHLGRVAPPRVEQQHQYSDHERHFGGQHHRSAIETIGQDSAPQTEHHQRDNFEQTQNSDGDVRTGDVGHLIRHRHERGRRTESGDQPRTEEQSVLAILPNRGQIHLNILVHGARDSGFGDPSRNRPENRAFSSPEPAEKMM